jgi:sugar transferase (PEP-CTERM/EpsH1 system associated)
MRILWIKVGGLFPVNTGGRRRSFEIVSALSQRHQVSLLTTHPPGEDEKLLREALPACHEVISVPHEIPKQGSLGFIAALARSWFSPLPVDLYRCRVEAVRQRAEQIISSGAVDVVVADFLAATPNLSLRREGKRPPVVLFEHNVESQIWRRLRDNEKSPLRRLLLEVEWRKLQRYEARACGEASRTIAVSDKDRIGLAKLAPGGQITSVATGVDTEYFAPQDRPQQPRELVFTGAMDWFPNEDGILNFVETTLPLIRKQVPEVRLTVVGRNPSEKLKTLAGAAGVRVTGTVDDVRPYLADGAVCIVPLRIGGGTRLKIFEALAMGKAVVSTTIGAEGLPVTPGEHLILADEPAAFASSVIELLQQPERRSALGKAGRELVEQNFAWPMVATGFEKQLTEVTHNAR